MEKVCKKSGVPPQFGCVPQILDDMREPNCILNLCVQYKCRCTKNNINFLNYFFIVILNVFRFF